MPVFTFEARTSSAQAQRGTQEAASAGAVAASVRQRGWMVLAVRTADDAGQAIDWRTVLNPLAWLSPRSLDIELSLQQMATMLRSGLTLLTSLRTIAEYAERRSMCAVWQRVAERIQQWASLGDAMAAHRCFNHMAPV